MARNFLAKLSLVLLLPSFGCYEPQAAAPQAVPDASSDAAADATEDSTALDAEVASDGAVGDALGTDSFAPDAAPDGAVADSTIKDASPDAPADDASADACPSTVDAASTAKPFTEYVWPLWPCAPDSPGASNYTVGTICGANVVTDKTTGLVWAQDEEPGSYNWADAKTRCESSRRAGFTDWRLPTRIELVSLIDYGKISPSATSIDSAAFPGASSAPKWSSSPVVGASGQAFTVGFDSSSSVTPSATTSLQGARCVRSFVAGGASSAFVLMTGDTEVKDSRTGLIWARAQEAGTYSQAEAVARCASKGGGYRLPTIRELQTLVDEKRYNPAIDPVFTIAAGSSSSAWSSTTVSVDGLTVGFTVGNSGRLSATTKIGARCVR